MFTFAKIESEKKGVQNYDEVNPKSNHRER